MNQKKELAKNTLILAIGKFSTQFVSFILLPFYTLFLTPAEFGTVDLVITYITLLAPVLTLQLEMASFRFLIDARDNDDSKKQIISSVLKIVAGIIATCALIFLVINAFVGIPYAYLILLNIVIAIFSGMFLQFARGLGYNKTFAIACTLAGGVTLVSNILLIGFAHMGADGILLSLAFANSASAVFLFFSLRLRKYIGISSSDITLQKQLVQYSLPLIPNGISWWAISLFDRTIIAAFLGVAANGIYAVSSKYATIFTSLFAIFGLSWTESASVHIKSKDRHIFFTDVFRASVRAFGSFGLLLIAALPFVFAIIGDQYAQAYLYVPILILAAFFNAVVGLYSAIYVARKMTKQVMTTTLVAAAINVTVNLTLITFIGLYAAAIATTVAYCAMAIYRHFDIKSFIHIHYEKRIVLSLALLYGLVTYLFYLQIPYVNYINLLIVVVAGILLNANTLRSILRK